MWQFKCQGLNKQGGQLRAANNLHAV